MLAPPKWLKRPVSPSNLQMVVMMLPYLYLVPYREARAVIAALAMLSWRKMQRGEKPVRGWMWLV